MTTATATDRRAQLERDGFCVFEQVLSEDLLARTREAADRLLDALPAEHFEQQKSTGSMVSVFDDPFFAELVAAPGALEALASLGYDEPAWRSGYIISKPPHSPALFWHQDWWGWDEEVSYTWDPPQQAFLMYYLVDTCRDNGCLRVLAGSHRRRHPMHDAVPDAHTGDLRAMTDPSHPAYQPVAGERDVPVKAGDVVIGDSRLLHAAHANCHDYRRTVITLWYYPAWPELPESLRAAVCRTGYPEPWQGEVTRRLGGLVPTYAGGAEPTGWNRIPGSRLR